MGYELICTILGNGHIQVDMLEFLVEAALVDAEVRRHPAPILGEMHVLIHHAAVEYDSRMFQFDLTDERDDIGIGMSNKDAKFATAECLL